jgi:hypothetical protein
VTKRDGEAQEIVIEEQMIPEKLQTFYFGREENVTVAEFPEFARSSFWWWWWRRRQWFY